MTPPSAAVIQMNPKMKTIEAPTTLRDLPGWLLWKFEHHAGEPKPRKIPYYVNGNRRHGVQGRPEDRKQLTTFEVARAAAARRGFDGLGFAPLPDFGVVALDFDRCVSDGVLDQDVENIVACTYAEFSPSGNGIRAFFKGDAGNNKSHDGPYGFETFSTKGFVTFTGNVLDAVSLLGTEDTVADLTADVKTLCTHRFGDKTPSADADPLMSYEPTIGLTPSQIEEALDVLDPDMPHDAWLHVGMGLHHETDGEGFEYWNAWSSKGSKYPGEETLRKRWDSFGSITGRPVTARSLVKLAQENGAYITVRVASSAEFDAVAKDSAPPANLRFKVEPAGEFSQGEHPGWIIKRLLPAAELIVMYGESGSGKSFVALDISMAIARGIEWRGLRTRQGRVVYVAAEGGGGFRKRLQAYSKQHNTDLSSIPFGVVNAAPNFLQKTDALDLAKAIVSTGGADLIVIDTFAQVTPGANENAAEDMGKALAHCKGLHRATGAPVLLVHHSGKDATKGARGWSGIKAALDAEIEVVRTAAGRYLRVSKQKDGDDNGEWGFDLEVVAVGVDEDGDTIDSCIVKESAMPVMGKVGGKKKMLGVWETHVVNVVSEFALAQSEGIEIGEVLAEVLRRTEKPEEGKRDTRKQHIKRAINTLSVGDESPYFVENGCITVL